jgi:phospholipid/cholesterol/gamma-HCH transport system permease protein
MLMRETDQMNALKVLGADINQWIIYPRILGYWLASIMLSIIFNAIALLTSAVLAVTKFSLDWSGYWAQMSQGVLFDPDITMWLYKALVFGWVVALVMIRQGMYVQPSNEGMANAVTRTVVFSSILILFVDMVVTSFSF